MYSVYILYSSRVQETYVGQTVAVWNRLAKHNAGRVRSTKHGVPWKMIWTEKFATRSAAMHREKWFKSPAGRRHIRKIMKLAELQ